MWQQYQILAVFISTNYKSMCVSASHTISSQNQPYLQPAFSKIFKRIDRLSKIYNQMHRQINVKNQYEKKE